jgi:CheY-like chemotaxis protein/HPt (histidine-containing phosphotransfer) domain-containing protein
VPAQPADAGSDARRPVAGHVLVVEDSPVNQRVAVGLLGKLGLAADVASNGREGLDALERRRYDAVLMDCLMPEMDGFEATRELRRREAMTGRPRTPVIALTASALASDREHCLQAGMDEYLTKPIQRRGLQEALSRWIRRGERDVVDMEAVRSILELEHEGAAGLFDELLSSFRHDGAARLVNLRRAVEAGDVRMVRQIAHTFRGEALAWGAEPLAERCRELEEFTHDGGTVSPGAGLVAPLDELEQLFEATLAALETVRAKAA